MKNLIDFVSSSGISMNDYADLSKLDYLLNILNTQLNSNDFYMKCRLLNWSDLCKRKDLEKLVKQLEIVLSIVRG